MKHGGLLWGAVAAALIVLPACGHRFPVGERLLPETYGPPFGSALKANIPQHPHNPADSERHAAADSEKNKTYSSHDSCHAALRAAVLAHGGEQENVVRISSIESMGYYAQGNTVHEHRCTDHVLSYRAWHPAGEGGGHGAGHGAGHKAQSNKGH